jgi:hypothetical protein
MDILIRIVMDSKKTKKNEKYILVNYVTIIDINNKLL